VFDRSAKESDVTTEMAYSFTNQPIEALTPGPAAMPFFMGEVLGAGNYDRIRVLAVLSATSTSPLSIAITLVDNPTSCNKYGLLDTLALKPGSQTTTVYECPGNYIVFWRTSTGTPGATAIVSLYAWGCPVQSAQSTAAPTPTPTPDPVKVISDK
jgi:hypothetical protein